MTNFDRVAPFYDVLAGAVFGGALLRAQRWTIRHGLPGGAARILFIGGGTGRVLPDLLSRAPQARITYVEASAEMLARARKRLQATAAPADFARVSFQLGTDAELPPTADFDVILTFFFLDVFPDSALPAAIARLQAAAAPSAVWLIADFVPARTHWQRALLAVMYRFFRLTAGLRTGALPHWPAALAAAGWQPTQTMSFVGTAVQAGVWRRSATQPR